MLTYANIFIFIGITMTKKNFKHEVHLLSFKMRRMYPYIYK